MKILFTTLLTLFSLTSMLAHAFSPELTDKAINDILKPSVVSYDWGEYYIDEGVLVFPSEICGVQQMTNKTQYLFTAPEKKGGETLLLDLCSKNKSIETLHFALNFMLKKVDTQPLMQLEPRCKYLELENFDGFEADCVAARKKNL